MEYNVAILKDFTKIHGKFPVKKSFLNVDAEFRSETLLIIGLWQMHFPGIYILLFRQATFEITSKNCNLNIRIY